MRMTLLQVMNLVVASAIASACMIPFMRCAEAGVMTWLLVSKAAAIIIPLVLIVTLRLLGVYQSRHAVAPDPLKPKDEP
jgi:hypothetical protein